MKRYFKFASLFLMLAIVLSACSTTTPTPTSAPTDAPLPEGCPGTSADTIVDLKCRSISIAVENAYLPFNYIELDTNEPGGWDYEAWDEICRRLNCVPVYTETAWDGMIQAIANGQLDAAGDGITITEERAKSVDFSMGYLKIQQRLLVRKGENRFTSLEDFVSNPDLLLATQANTTNYATAAEVLPEERIQGFEQMPFAVQALISGDVDAVIIDEVLGMGYMGENADLLEFVGPSISSDELGFAFPKGSDLVDPINQAIQSMMDDGFLTQLNVKYFGPEFNITYDDIQ